MMPYLESLIQRRQLQNNVLPKQSSKFENNRSDKLPSFQESSFYETEREMTTDPILKNRKSKIEPQDNFNTELYNNQYTKDHNKKDLLYKDPIKSNTSEISNDDAQKSTTTPIKETNASIIGEKENQKTTESKTIIIEAKAFDEYSNDNKNNNSLKVLDIANGDESQNSVTVTIGKLEIKALKQEKIPVKNAIKKPALTLEQYIKNKSNK